MQSQLTRDNTPPAWPPSRWQRPLARAGLLVFLGMALIILRQLPLVRFDARSRYISSSIPQGWACAPCASFRGWLIQAYR